MELVLCDFQRLYNLIKLYLFPAIHDTLRRVSGVTRDSHCTFIAFYNGQLFAASAD
jgi:hypothetical protein